jgi:hypothetical protein
MTPAIDECADGALSYDDGARFLGVCKRTLELIVARGELDVVYEGKKPRVLKRQLRERLARQLEQSRAGAGARTPARH